MGNYEASGEKMHYVKKPAAIIWSMSMAIAGTRILGPVKMKRIYDCANASEKHVSKDCLKAFSDMGLLIELECEPETLACYVKRWYSEPMVFTANIDPDTLRLTLFAYSRQALFARVILFFLLRGIEKEVGGIERVSLRVVKQEKRKARKERKEEKKAEREKKKKSWKIRRAEKRLERAEADLKAAAQAEEDPVTEPEEEKEGQE